LVPAAAFLIVIKENFLSNGILHRYHLMGRYLLYGYGGAGFVCRAQRAVRVAMEAFKNRPSPAGARCYQFLGARRGPIRIATIRSCSLPAVCRCDLYYAPQLLALVFAGRAILRGRGKADSAVRERACVSVFILLLAAQVLMDAGMVSIMTGPRQCFSFFGASVRLSKTGRGWRTLRQTG
jgi:hypothetical protein